MKGILLTLFAFAPFALLAQEKNSNTESITLGVSFSPDYSYRDLRHDGSEMMKNAVALNNEWESPKLGYTSGISIKFPLISKLSFETGIYFADKGEKLVIDASQVTFGDLIDPRYGFVYETSEVFATSTSNRKYMYLDIPMKLEYLLIDKKISISITGGPSLNTLVKYNRKTKTRYQDGSTKVSSNSTTTASLLRFNLGMVSSININFPLNDRLGLELEPTYRRSLTPINNDRIKEYLYSTGMSVGLTYKLGG